MPWRCPACDTPIRHSGSEHAPLAGQVYRCPVCKLELVVDPKGGRMILAPIEGSDAPKKSAPR